MLLGVITFISVFLLGFQQKNVQHDKYTMAMITSAFISFMQFTVYRGAAAGTEWDWIYMSIGSALGIVSSMYMHNKLRAKSCTKDE